MGVSALRNNVKGYYNTAVGYSALPIMIHLIFHCNRINAMFNHKNGYWNTGVGMQALYTDQRDNRIPVGRTNIVL